VRLCTEILNNPPTVHADDPAAKCTTAPETPKPHSGPSQGLRNVGAARLAAAAVLHTSSKARRGAAPVVLDVLDGRA
jgi:hypothetical protein